MAVSNLFMVIDLRPEEGSGDQPAGRRTDPNMAPHLLGDPSAASAMQCRHTLPNCNGEPPAFDCNADSQFFAAANTTTGESLLLEASSYGGPLPGLQWTAIGSGGDDVLDGAADSNFLTGGAGKDTFFLDGRGGAVTWSTVTDLEASEHVDLWGWQERSCSPAGDAAAIFRRRSPPRSS
ncbi:calcium-binding protein [Azospirillum argentinense]|nr:calcium-binding protein [Azospirillum argentinense]